MRKGWKKVRLGDVVKLNYGKSLTSTNRITGSIPVYSSAGITGFHNKALVESAGVIIGRKGTVGTVYYSPVSFFCIDTAYYILPSEDYDLKYIFYRLSSLGLENLNEDSAVPGLNRDTAYNQLFLLPPLSEQRLIATILSYLDDKIALNTKINHHLEQMAQAIYAHAFPCSDSPTTPICSFIDVRDGTHDSPKAVEQGFPLVTSKHLLSYGVDKVSPNRICKADFDKINERSKVDRYDILISMIGTIGLISLVIERNICFAIKNVGLFKTSQAKDWVYFVLCFLRSPETKNHIDMRLAGSTQKYISLGELRQLPVVIPTVDDLRIFNDSVRPLFEKIALHTEETARFVTLRDTLLPRLMSGELSVADIDTVK